MSNAFTTSKAPCDVLDDWATLTQRPPRHEWRRIALIGLLLGISGGVRYWRDWTIQSLSKESESAPFALSGIPGVLGTWHVVEGTETTLDPEIAQIAGSSDHIIRTYINERSGEKAVVMVIYGLAYLVWPHVPEACFPSAGFVSVPPTRDVEIRIPQTGTTARFQVQTFVKNTAGQGDYQEVYHSFCNAGQWGFDMGKNWKTFRYHPGMFKVQVQRQVFASGKTEDGSMEQLLGSLVQEIETRSTAVPDRRTNASDLASQLDH